MTVETKPEETKAFEKYLHADDLEPTERDYLTQLGFEFVDREECFCPWCKSIHTESFSVGLPGGERAVAGWRCEECGQRWVLSEEEGEMPKISLPEFAALTASKAERVRRELRNAGENLSASAEEEMRYFIRDINQAIRENRLPISRAERDAILAVALPVGPEDVGATPAA